MPKTVKTQRGKQRRYYKSMDMSSYHSRSTFMVSEMFGRTFQGRLERIYEGSNGYSFRDDLFPVQTPTLDFVTRNCFNLPENFWDVAVNLFFRIKCHANTVSEGTIRLANVGRVFAVFIQGKACGHDHHPVRCISDFVLVFRLKLMIKHSGTSL